jgi:hypothetical protein
MSGCSVSLSSNWSLIDPLDTRLMDSAVVEQAEPQGTDSAAKVDAVHTPAQSGRHGFTVRFLESFKQN